MEKLVLKGIMYGADKIPDSWFEKMPGGYYRAKTKNGRPAKPSRRHSSDSHDSRNYSRHRPQNSGASNPHHSHYGPGNHYDERSRQHRGTTSRQICRHVSSPRQENAKGDEKYYHDDREGRPRVRLPQISKPKNSRSVPTPMGNRGPPPNSEQTGYVPPIIQPAAAEDPIIKSSTKIQEGIRLTNQSIVGDYVPYAHLYGNSRKMKQESCMGNGASDSEQSATQARFRPYPLGGYPRHGPSVPLTQLAALSSSSQGCLR